MKIEFEIYLKGDRVPEVLRYTWSGHNSAGITPVEWFAAIGRYCLKYSEEAGKSPPSSLTPQLTDIEIKNLRDLLRRWAN